jgi:cytosine/adenosine deaminase-related metal-dependent hydrolase
MHLRRIVTPRVALLLSFNLWAGSWIQAAERPIAFVDVTVVSMKQEQVVPGQTVMVLGSRIAKAGPNSSIKLPADAIKIDGRGDFLMPGLADMHVHLIRSLDAVRSQASSSALPAAHTIPPLSASDDYERENHALGLLYVSNGITSVRNMWGDPAIDSYAREIELGQALGPHVYSTGPITDGSPYVWQGSRVVGN